MKKHQKSLIYLGIRIPESLGKKMDKFVEESLYFRTRSEFVRKLIEDYLKEAEGMTGD
jgi:metal-responsive CopG/Arc/MetJ family transcriptional regulator